MNRSSRLDEDVVEADATIMCSIRTRSRSPHQGERFILRDSTPRHGMCRLIRCRISFCILVSTVVRIGVGTPYLRVRHDAIAASAPKILERGPTVTIHR